MAFSSADPDAFVALGIQSAQGTPQTTAARLRFVRYISGNAAAPEIEAVDMREGGGGLDWFSSYKRRQVVRGQVVLYARPDPVGLGLAAALGGATWTGASTPALHNFHSNHASHPWVTMYAGHPGTQMVQMYSDLKFTGFTLEAAAGDPLKLTLPFIGINHRATTVPLAPTYHFEQAYWLYHDTASYQFDGALATGIESWTLSHELGAEELQSYAVTLDDIAIQNRDINLELTKRFVNKGLWDKVYNGASGNAVPTTAIATSQFLAINIGPSNLRFEVNVPLLSLRSAGLTELDPDGQTVRETFSAKGLSGGATHSTVIQLQNLHASAYA